MIACIASRRLDESAITMCGRTTSDEFVFMDRGHALLYAPPEHESLLQNLSTCKLVACKHCVAKMREIELAILREAFGQPS